MSCGYCSIAIAMSGAHAAAHGPSTDLRHEGLSTADRVFGVFNALGGVAFTFGGGCGCGCVGVVVCGAVVCEVWWAQGLQWGGVRARRRAACMPAGCLAAACYVIVYKHVCRLTPSGCAGPALLTPCGSSCAHPAPPPDPASLPCALLPRRPGCAARDPSHPGPAAAHGADDDAGPHPVVCSRHPGLLWGGRDGVCSLWGGRGRRWVAVGGRGRVGWGGVGWGPMPWPPAGLSRSHSPKRTNACTPHPRPSPPWRPLPARARHADVLLNLKEPAGLMAAANLMVVLHVAAAWQVGPAWRAPA